VRGDDALAHSRPDEVHQQLPGVLGGEDFVAQAVDCGTLLVHHVIVFEQTLTDTEVVFLHLLLCSFDALGDEWAFDTLAFLKSEAVHYLSNTLRSEETHQFVFQ